MLLKIKNKYSYNKFLDQNTACWKTSVNWNCQDGHIIVHKAAWETGRLCGDGYTSFKSLDVVRILRHACEKRQNCSFIVSDYTFKVSCATANSRCTVLDYVYACISKYSNINTTQKCQSDVGSYFVS